ncbi:MAG: GNAT family N-acetyltransferase [Marmoricola sp.]
MRFTAQIDDGVLLGPLEPWQAEEFAANLQRAGEHIRPWVGAGFVTDTVDDARATLDRYVHRAADDGARLYGIWANDVLVGGVMFAAFDAERGIGELGCWLEPAAQGNGYVISACRMLIEWAFETRGLHRIEWRCRAGNERSARVAARLGMQLEGTLRQTWKTSEGFDDTQVWALLKDPDSDRTV